MKTLIDPPTRRRIVDFAATDEDASAIWTEIKPDMSNAAHTFWVSMDDDYPYILVDPVAGDHFMPNKRCHAFAYGEATGYADVDRWLAKHRSLLDKLLRGRIDQFRFYQVFESARIDARRKSR